jgi:hypothetical protein
LRIVYIGGIGRSGSTLIDRLLGQVPGVCAIGELVYMWQRGIAEGNRCGCGEPFQRCPFWQEVLTAAFGGSHNVDSARVEHLRAAVDRARFIPWLLAPSLRPAFQAKLDEYVTYCTRIYDAVREVSGCEVIADASKAPSYAFCLRSSPNVDLRVVHVVRDSRAVAYSWTRKVPRAETNGPTYMPTLRPARTAGQWNYHNAALQILEATGTPTLRVRYEDLVSRPYEKLAEIAEFTGVASGPEQLGFMGADEAGWWADLSVAHIASGNRMRFKTGRIPIRLDDEWRASMSSTDRRTVTALTLPLLGHYGYLAPGAQA